MAQKKGLMSPTKDLSFNNMYAAFGAIPESGILSPEEIGLTDDAVIQLRQAVYGVGTGAMTIDKQLRPMALLLNRISDEVAFMYECLTHPSAVFAPVPRICRFSL